MKKIAFTCVILASLAVVPSAGSAQPAITIYTDADTYQSGDTIEVSLSAQNDREGMSVAVYVGLLTPDGGIYTGQLEGWSASLEPWIPNIYLPSGFSMDQTPFWLFDAPCDMPPIQELGDYSFAAVLTYPGTFDCVSLVSFAPFTVSSETGFHGGEVSRDMTMSGDITLTSDVVIHEGVVLTILPGSRVRLGNNVGIHVHGGLVAEGDGPDSIVFERLVPSEAWENISFGDSADDDQCRLAHCSISGGGGTLCYGYTRGGAVFCCESSPAIEDNTITSNSADHGGGICCIECSPTITNNTISDNMASFMGGGIHCYCSSPAIHNNTVTYNSANRGGGIYSFGSNSSPTIQSNTVAHNSAAFGGGIVCSSCSGMIKNNMIEGNGGGIYCHYSSPTISSNTIINNVGPDHGGGVCCYGFSAPTIIDCIIWGNGNNLEGHDQPHLVTYCCIEGNNWGEGNIHDDPTFVTGPLGAYYLRPDSPCIDAGSRSAEDAGLSDGTTQADGTPDTGTVDMGFHYPIP